MSKKLKFSVQNCSVSEPVTDSKFAKISVDFFASGHNAHDLYVSEDVLERTADTIYNAPLVWKYDPVFDDAGTHDPQEVVCGLIMDGEPIERIRLEDGRIMLRVVGYIWKKYSGSLMEILARDSGNKPVSVEISIFEETEDEDGKKFLSDYAFEAITILGTYMTPAIPSAEMNVLSFSDNAEEIKMAYKLEFSKYSDIDFNIPTSVKKNSKDGLSLKRQFGFGTTAVSTTMAKYLIRESEISSDKVQQVFKYLRKRDVSGFGKDSPEWTAWQLYGGKASLKWTGRIIREMNVIDEQLMTYFNESPSAEEADGRKEQTSMTKEKLEEFVDETEAEEEDENVMMEESAPESEDQNIYAEGKEDESPEEDMAVEEDESPEEDMAAEEDESESEDGDEDDAEEEDMASLFALAQERIVSLESENEELRKFKADVETQQFELKVSAILAETRGVFSAEELDVAKIDAKENYSLETLDGFRNAMLAKAFEKSEGIPSDSDDGILRYSFPEILQQKTLDGDSIWQAYAK